MMTRNNNTSNSTNDANDDHNVPIGLPAESVCWNERRDCRVGFSSAAATGTAVSKSQGHTGRDKQGTGCRHTGLLLVHSVVGIGL